MAFDMDVTVASADDLNTALADTRAANAIGRRHRIACDWDGISEGAVSAQGFQRRPDGWLDNGGGVLIEAAAGRRPAIGGQFRAIGTRGLHVRRIGLANQSDGVNRTDVQNGAQIDWNPTMPARPVVKLEQCGIGAGFWRPGQPHDQWIDGITVTAGCDLIRLQDCTIKGVENAARLRARNIRIDGCDFQASKQDCIQLFPQTTGEPFYLHAWVSRSTFRNLLDILALAAFHTDMIQSGTAADRHLGYRIRMEQLFAHMAHSFVGTPSEGGGTQGNYNDDHVFADNELLLRDSILLTSAMAALAMYSPRATMRSWIENSVLSRAGRVPSGFAGDANAPEDYSPGLVMNDANGGVSRPGGPWLNVRNSCLGTMPTHPAVAYQDCVLVDPRIGRPAEVRPEALFAGRDFTRGGAAANNVADKFAYDMPNEAGSQAQFVADLWANWRPIGANAGKFCPDPTGIVWSAPTP